MGHMRGLGTARDSQVTDCILGYGVCIHIWQANATFFFIKLNSEKDTKSESSPRLFIFTLVHSYHFFIFTTTVKKM